MKDKEEILRREVYQSNALIEATYNVSLNGFKLLRLLASMINKYDEDFKEYTFRVIDLMDLFEIKGASSYSEIPKITKELMSKVIVIPKEKGFTQYPLLIIADHDIGSGRIKIGIHPRLKPFFFDLSGNYTKYELENILKLKSTYSIQVYELMKMNHYKGDIIYTIEDLKRITGATTKAYEKYFNFKNRVLRVSKNEINKKTDISFDFEEIKTGRKVTSLKFYINSNKYKKKNEEDYKDEIAITIDDYSNPIEDNINYDLLEPLVDKGIAFKQAKSILLKYTREQIKRNIDYAIKDHSRANKSNLAGFLVKAIEEDYARNIKARKKNNQMDLDHKYDMDQLEKKLLQRTRG